jgi:secreted PhoX family phosphatase
MAKDFSMMEHSSPEGRPTIHTVSTAQRRTFLQGGLAAFLSPLAVKAGTATALLASAGCASTTPATPAAPAAPAARMGFKGVGISTADTVTVPEGYTAQVIAAWGEPVGVPGAMPAFKWDASNSAADQAVQMGMHHDGIHYYPLDGSRRGLLAMNHEYTDDGLLHVGGTTNWSAEKVAKSQAAHGVSVIEVAQQTDGSWQPVRPSRYARRITANTPCTVSGPAAGHALLQTALDPSGRRVLGTLNNCGSGITPWGTYLTCEENFIGYFRAPNRPDAHQRRWGMRPGDGFGYRWAEFDARFDSVDHPNEPNRFGWVVEIDPMDPTSAPIKRTALGRAAREGATVALTKDQRAVVYMGEDARFEYIYKFVSAGRVQPGGAKANATLLDSGTLYVARFDADGTGRWLPLRHGQGPLTAANGFADAGEVLVKARQASDALGGTQMDRPEWIAIDPQGFVYCTLTNNSQRGQAGRPAPDGANPRAENTTGHIIRWKESADFDAETFSWNHFVLAGDPANERAEARGNAKGQTGFKEFACPDGLWVDGRGMLWIQTDMSTREMGKGDLARLGHNVMLCADPVSGEIRRFLTGPAGCEITGATGTPDGRTMFINIQHPGEPADDRSEPNAVRAISNWPDHRPDGRPRSATVVIRKLDGGFIST